MRPTNFRYVGFQSQFSDGSLIPTVGGLVFPFQAGGTLNVGDNVQLAGTGIVNKSTGTTTKVIGVVVGGASFQGDGQIVEFDVTSPGALITAGIVAAINGQQVYVLVSGVFYVVADGVIANGALIKPSGTTAGQVTSATADTDQGSIIGKLIDVASAVAGDVRLALISLM